MNKVIIILISVSILAVIAGATLMSGESDDRLDIEANENTSVFIDKTSFDWGTIGLNDGNVEHAFDILNEGSEPLVLSDIATSCMCTTATLILGEDESPVFGMHTKSDYQLTVPSGETAKLKVVFDPAFHGPSGIGPISRTITINTNDPERPELRFMLTAVVRK